MKWVMINKSRINMDHVRCFSWSNDHLHVQFDNRPNLWNWYDPDKELYFKMCWSQGIRPDGWNILRLIPLPMIACVTNLVDTGKQKVVKMTRGLVRWLTYEEEETTVDDRMELKPCPFCGAELKDTWITVHEYKTGQWVLSHNCGHVAGELSTCITVYGKSKKEVVGTWNHRVRRRCSL